MLHKYKGSVSEAVVALICVPRAHDIGKSGWIVAGVLGAYLVAVIGLVSYFDRDDAMIALGVVAIVMTALIILLGVIRGDKGANRFGDPPRPRLHLWSGPTKAPPTA